MFLLESVLCKWSLIAICLVRIVSTLQLSFMLSHFIAQYGQSQTRKSFKRFLWFVCVCRSLLFTWLTLQNTVPCLHGSRVTYIKWFIVHCELQWASSKNVSKPNWLYIFSVFQVTFWFGFSEVGQYYLILWKSLLSTFICGLFNDVISSSLCIT